MARKKKKNKEKTFSAKLPIDNNIHMEEMEFELMIQEDRKSFTLIGMGKPEICCILCLANFMAKFVQNDLLADSPIPQFKEDNVDLH